MIIYIYINPYILLLHSSRPTADRFNARTEGSCVLKEVISLCFSVVGYHASCAGSEVLILLRHFISGETSPVSPLFSYVM